MNLAPLNMRLVPCREGTKQSRLIDLLARPEGATPEELIEACKPWDWEVLKSALYWDVNKVKGYGIRSENGRLFLLPEGVSAPLPHKPLLPVPKPTAHHLDIARRLEKDTGKSPAEMRGKEIADHCARLGIRTKKGKAFTEANTADFRRRLRAFLKSGS